MVRWGEEMLRLWSIPGRVATREGRGPWPGSVLWESLSGTTASLPAWPQAAGGHSPPRACTECPRGPRPASPGHMTVAGGFLHEDRPRRQLPSLSGRGSCCLCREPREAALASGSVHSIPRGGRPASQRSCPPSTQARSLGWTEALGGPSKAATSRGSCSSCQAPLPCMWCPSSPGLDHVRGSTSAWGADNTWAPRHGSCYYPGGGGAAGRWFPGGGTPADNTGSLGARGRAVRRPS